MEDDNGKLKTKQIITLKATMQNNCYTFFGLINKEKNGNYLAQLSLKLLISLYDNKILSNRLENTKKDERIQITKKKKLGKYFGEKITKVKHFKEQNWGRLIKIKVK
jgi:hypothetical protein